MRDRLTREETLPEDRVDLGFALGGALDRAGAYDEAFVAFVEANRVARQSAAARGFRYDRARQEGFVDRLIATFDRPVPAGGGDPGGPLFICGMFRSGSTLAEQILSRHPALSYATDLDDILHYHAPERRLMMHWRALYAHASGRWRNYRRQLEGLADRARALGLDPGDDPIGVERP